MERREFLKLTLGFTAAAGAMVAAAATAQAAPVLPQTSDVPPVGVKPNETAPAAKEAEPVTASRGDTDSEMSSRRRWRRRFWRPRRRRFWRRRRRVIYY
jgi:hypothetical protein